MNTHFAIGLGPSLEANLAFTQATLKITADNLLHCGALVVGPQDLDLLRLNETECLHIPAFVVCDRDFALPEGLAAELLHLDDLSGESAVQRIESAAEAYEKQVMPPFFRALATYCTSGNQQFDCPGHQGGDFFRQHPAGNAFTRFFGDNIFHADLCNADIALGDLLIHEGPAYDAQAHAAKVFHADKTYFILNGTSAANRVVLQALLAPGDLVLYDRNNHKSVCHGALLQAGALPVYVETARNPYGSIGGILPDALDERKLRQQASALDPARAKAKRPFRVAVIQLGTYDGVMSNAKRLVETIGHLCDYILFDSAWVGYEQFIPMLKDCSPLLLDLGPDDPGIIVTQSVHKQQAGFSQTSQIHKKDSHIQGQSRYVNHKRFNNAYMMQASTSPFYPLFASLDINAAIHEGPRGQYLWHQCIVKGIEARKDMLKRCHHLRPFVPPTVHGKPWASGESDAMAKDLAYFTFDPDASWHGFKGYSKDQYRIDPCKLQVTTPGIDPETGVYADFGIPATILANYLREHGCIPEKCDLNTILFLLTPAESKEKYDRLVDLFVDFERAIDEDRPLAEVLPSLYAKQEARYKDYSIRQLCQEMHDFYKDQAVSDLQRKLFLQDSLPVYAMAPQAAHITYMSGAGELLPLSAIEGRIALEGALPYPPGLICVQPGERWTTTALSYFKALEEGINRFPGFAPELQGVYLEENEAGRIEVKAYVLD